MVAGGEPGPFQSGFQALFQRQNRGFILSLKTLFRGRFQRIGLSLETRNSSEEVSEKLFFQRRHQGKCLCQRGFQRSFLLQRKTSEGIIAAPGVAAEFCGTWFLPPAHRSRTSPQSAQSTHKNAKSPRHPPTGCPLRGTSDAVLGTLLSFLYFTRFQNFFGSFAVLRGRTIW